MRLFPVRPLGRLAFLARTIRLVTVYTLAMNAAAVVVLALGSRLVGVVLFPLLMAGAIAVFLALVYWRTRDISAGNWLFPAFLAQVTAGLMTNTGKEPVGAVILLFSLWIFLWPGRRARGPGA